MEYSIWLYFGKVSLWPVPRKQGKRMTLRFSERLGLVDVSTAIQVDSMDKRLRAGLWNLFYIHVIDHPSYHLIFDSLSRILWQDLYGEPVNEAPSYESALTESIQERFFESPWFHPYEFLEFILTLTLEGKSKIRRELNPLLERERSGYRLVNDVFAPITEPEEILSVETASTVGPFVGAKEHIKHALQHYANREKPDYRNCVKEAISAVEAVVRELTGKDDLARALAVLENKHSLPTAMKEGFIKLYSYTNEENGIRHAMLTSGGAVEEPDARYMLVTCSAFVNFLVSRYATESATTPSAGSGAA